MNRVKCPKCGKSNYVIRSTCFHCGSSLVNALEAGTDSSKGKSLPLIGATLCLLSTWLFGPINFMAMGWPASCASAGCCACEIALLILSLVAFPVGYAIGWTIGRIITSQTIGFVVTIATAIVAGAVLFSLMFLA